MWCQNKLERGCNPKTKEELKNLKLSILSIFCNGSMSTLNDKVMDILDRVGVLGATPKQVASKLNITTEIARNIIDELKAENKVIRVGRGLWILTKYKYFNSVQDFVTPDWYKCEFEKTYGPLFSTYDKKILANENYRERIHRWFFCVQGFSAEFVNDMLNKYEVREGDFVVDPFAGSGTVLVCARMKNINSIGVELLPLLSFACKVKTFWDINIENLKNETTHLLTDIVQAEEVREFENPFLKETERQFQDSILKKLLELKRRIFEVKDENIRKLLKLALASILVPCSNLKRAPCLGYAKKNVNSEMVSELFRKKIRQLINDLTFVEQNGLGNDSFAEVIIGDSRKVKFKEETIKLAITSPPYVNGLDYVINYKIEMAWLELIHSYNELSNIKAEMVACDNVPRRVTTKLRTKNPSYSDKWLERIISQIKEMTECKSNYRRDDMYLIVGKYFEDLYPVFENIYEGLENNGRFIVVIGDSLIAGVYIPTDLILAKMGERVGFSIESIKVARKRRSGQRRDFMLRESIIVLKKESANLTRQRSLFTYF